MLDISVKFEDGIFADKCKAEGITEEQLAARLKEYILDANMPRKNRINDVNISELCAVIKYSTEILDMSIGGVKVLIDRKEV